MVSHLLPLTPIPHLSVLPQSLNSNITTDISKMRKERDVLKEKLEGLLKTNPRGMSIEELSSRMHLNRATIKNMLSELKGAEKIIERPIGQVKLHYWNYKGDE